MAIVYFDSSAFVKLLVEEEGTDLATALWDSCDAAVSSRLAYPEVCAALAAAKRDGRLSARGHAGAITDWDSYWAATRPVELTNVVCRAAGQLAEAHALRGADAIHLASARAIDSPTLIVAAWDARLRAGAQQLGLALAPG